MRECWVWINKPYVDLVEGQIRLEFFKIGDNSANNIKNFNIIEEELIESISGVKKYPENVYYKLKVLHGK